MRTLEGVRQSHVHDGIVVEVFEQHGRREGGNVMLARTLVSVTAGADLYNNND